MVGGFDLGDHGFVGEMTGAQGSDGGKAGEQGGTQCDAEYPALAAVLGLMMDFFVQMFGWDFGFFHYD